MGKGSYYPGKPIVTVEGIKASGGGTAITVGNAVEVDTALTPDGWKNAAAGTTGKVGVLMGFSVTDSQTTGLVVAVNGSQVLVQFENAVQPGAKVMVGASGQFKAFDATANADKGIFTGLVEGKEGVNAVAGGEIGEIILGKEASA